MALTGQALPFDFPLPPTRLVYGPPPPSRSSQDLSGEASRVITLEDLEHALNKAFVKDHALKELSNSETPRRPSTLGRRRAKTSSPGTSHPLSLIKPTRPAQAQRRTTDGSPLECFQIRRKLIPGLEAPEHVRISPRRVTGLRPSTSPGPKYPQRNASLPSSPPASATSTTFSSTTTSLRGSGATIDLHRTISPSSPSIPDSRPTTPSNSTIPLRPQTPTPSKGTLLSLDAQLTLVSMDSKLTSPTRSSLEAALHSTTPLRPSTAPSSSSTNPNPNLPFHPSPSPTTTSSTCVDSDTPSLSTLHLSLESTSTSTAPLSTTLDLGWNWSLASSNSSPSESRPTSPLTTQPQSRPTRAFHSRFKSSGGKSGAKSTSMKSWGKNSASDGRPSTSWGKVTPESKRLGGWGKAGRREAIPEVFKKADGGARADLLAGEASLVDEVSRSGWYSSDEEEDGQRGEGERVGEARKFSLGGLAGGSLKKSWMRRAGFFRSGSA